ncbi:MAG: redox-sensing transcriptional repressor Rex [Candidatus Omnitrophica bacterium]|nr:redox-sensing transcriptional repressor Rex [Candidatus Omnitrophota bacterium]MCM8828856.1 redox-sensing transcriptional repressor Rex [Candidatus Omnitrophota bacterium]
MRKTDKIRIPQETIRRLALYLRSLRKLSQQNLTIVSSSQITNHLNVTSDQFRKDLSYFGSLGKPGVGYRVDELIEHLEKILGVDSERRIILAGVGKLGSALLAYPGFLNFNFRIVAAFDNDPVKIGKKREGIRIEDISRMREVVSRFGVRLAILAVPAESAQSVAEKLVECGIRGILNFAPVNLDLSQKVYVLDVDMGTELMALTYFSRRVLL